MALAARWLLGVSIAGWLHSASAEQAIPVRIDGIQVLLFNAKTGGFSADVLGSDAPALGNVPAGNFASTAALVIVRIKLGPDLPVPDKLRVHLTATDTGRLPVPGRRKTRRVLPNQSIRPGPIGPDGLSHVGFWLNDSGCNTIELDAKIEGKDVSAAPLKTAIPFACYE